MSVLSRRLDRPPRARWARWAALLLVAGAILAAGPVGARFGKDPSLVASPLIGKPAPGFTLPYLERPGTLSLARLRGQIVVVNFWASWCVACRQEHPDLMAAARTYAPKGVRFVGIVYQDRREQAIAMLNELGRSYDNLLDPGSRTAIDFGLFGVPETFFVDRQGIVVAKITGRSTYPLLSGVLDQILAGTPPRSPANGPVQPGPGQPWQRPG